MIPWATPSQSFWIAQANVAADDQERLDALAELAAVGERPRWLLEVVDTRSGEVQERNVLR